LPEPTPERRGEMEEPGSPERRVMGRQGNSCPGGGENGRRAPGGGAEAEEACLPLPAG
jgi:hypothetical protein